MFMDLNLPTIPPCSLLGLKTNGGKICGSASSGSWPMRSSSRIEGDSGVYEDSTHLVACQKQTGLYYGRRSFTTCAVSSLLRQVSVGEGVPLPRPRIQVVHGTVPQKCARNALPAPSGILSRPALRELRCHPLPTSSTRAPEVTPN